MEGRRYYRRIGTEDFPVSSMISVAGRSMMRYCHWHSEPEFIYIIQGSVQIRLGTDVVTAQAGDFHIVPPYEIHGNESFSADAVARRVVFDPLAIAMTPTHFFQKSFVTPLAENRLKMPRSILPGHPAYEVIKENMLKLEECKTYDPDYQVNRFGILMTICTSLFPYCQVDTSQSGMQDPGNQAVLLTMRYINSHYNKKLDLQTLADNVHLHPNYLCALFKTHTGETVFQHITRIRIESAAYYLREDDIPMNKVAELSGFSTESLFYHKFREIMGMTPRAYKKKYRQEQAEDMQHNKER